MMRVEPESRLNAWLSIIGDCRVLGQREISDGIVSKI